MGALSGERTRWAQRSLELSDSYECLIGDVTVRLSAGGGQVERTGWFGEDKVMVICGGGGGQVEGRWRGDGVEECTIQDRRSEVWNWIVRRGVGNANRGGKEMRRQCERRMGVERGGEER